MPTPNMSDEELDDLVRRSAEAYPEELPLGNWLRMEDQLHKAATERLIRQRLWQFFGLEVAIVALLLLLWQGYRAVNPAASAPQDASNKTFVTTHAQPATSAPTLATQPKAIEQAGTALPAASSIPLFDGRAQKPATSSTEQASSTVATTSLPSKSRARQVGLGQPLAAILAPKRRTFTATAQAEPRPGAAAGNEDKMQGPARSTHEVFSSTQPTVALLPAQEAATVVMPMNFHSHDVTQHFALPLTLPSQETLAHTPTIPIVLVDSVPTPKETAPFYRVVVGVIGAPAWSAVRTISTAQLGGNLGLTLEYRLTPRLRLRSGLVRSVKRYAAASSDYTPQPAWNWRPGTYEVYANCRITEIPLDLRYDLVSRPTYSVFASAGLTSLLMRHERYAYDYQAGGQTRTAVAKVVNGSNYAFGLFTVSAGVERPVGSRWSMQAEPFVQLPLGSVGAGKVRLSSAGASFSIKYGLLR